MIIEIAIHDDNKAVITRMEEDGNNEYVEVKYKYDSEENHLKDGMIAVFEDETAGYIQEGAFSTVIKKINTSQDLIGSIRKDGIIALFKPCVPQKLIIIK